MDSPATSPAGRHSPNFNTCAHAIAHSHASARVCARVSVGCSCSAEKCASVSSVASSARFILWTLSTVATCIQTMQLILGVHRYLSYCYGLTGDISGWSALTKVKIMCARHRPLARLRLCLRACLCGW
eukprot:COSAG01_NODE_957_length_12474_cov_44.298182_15_plen_128_part_00